MEGGPEVGCVGAGIPELSRTLGEAGNRLVNQTFPPGPGGPEIRKFAVREVRIEKVMNGYHARVGCQNLVFETAERMLSELARYYADPAKVEKEYLEKYFCQ